MSSSKPINEASASTQAIVYQLWVALEKCYEMADGQSVVVEREGDVTIPGHSQIETKLYGDDDALTDSHLNVWKTLRNWMDVNSHSEQYAALILRTNQSFGANTRFKNWNKSEPAGRIKILEAILAASEARLSSSKTPSKLSDSHAIQRSVMDTAKATKLSEVVSKFLIADKSPGLPETYDRLKSSQCGHIPQANQDLYLGALMNVILRPETIDQNWMITKAEFNEELVKANAMFCQGSRRFPQLYRTRITSSLTPEQEALRAHPFVSKIRDINHDERIPQAIRDYHDTQGIIIKDFQDHAVELPAYTKFAREVEAQFELGFSIAQQQQSKNSKIFYDITIRENSPPFDGYDFAPRDFKNGVLHMHLNNAIKPHKWKLEP